MATWNAASQPNTHKGIPALWPTGKVSPNATFAPSTLVLAITGAGWDMYSQIREKVSFTKGRIIGRGKLHASGEQKRVDYIPYYKSNIPQAVIEAKENGHSVGGGGKW